MRSEWAQRLKQEESGYNTSSFAPLKVKHLAVTKRDTI